MTTPQTQAALLREAAQNALTTLDGIANANPRDKDDFDSPDEWIAWAKSRARWAADALREPVAREVYAERILKQMLQATQAEPPKDVSMPQYWSVDVFSDGAKIVSIGNDWLSGERPLDEIDERTIIGAAQHLLSFVGHGLPPTSFDPDAQAEPAQAGELPDERPVRVNRGTLSIARDAIEYEKGNAHKQGYKQGYQQGKEDERQRALSARKPTDAWQDVSACPDGDVWFSLSCGHVVMGYKHGAIFDWEANIDHDCCGDATATKAMPVTPPDSYGIGLEVKT